MLFPLAIMIASIVPIQDQAPEEDPSVLLNAAVQKLVEGGVAHVAIDVDRRDTGAGMGFMVQTGIERPDPFEGGLEFWRPTRGESLLISTRRVPGLELYEAGGRRLVRTTHEGVGIDVGRLDKEVSAILDWKRLAKWVAKADVTSPADGRFEAEISSRLIPRDGAEGMMGFMDDKVMHVDSRFEVGADGAMREMVLEVVRADPFAAMRRKMMSGELQGGVITPDDAFDEESEPEEGVRTIYRVTFPSEEPGSRLKQSLVAMRDLSTL